MNIGVVREIKNNENRVAVVPSGVETLTRGGHAVFVEAGAGAGTSLPDPEYQEAGATVLPDAASRLGAAARSSARSRSRSRPSTR